MLCAVVEVLMSVITAGLSSMEGAMVVGDSDCSDMSRPLKGGGRCQVK